MRLGINVPNELINRVKAAQPDVNISQVCREALEDLVARKDTVMSRVNADGSAERILEVSRSQDNPLVEPDWAGYAWEDAKDWVSKVTPEEWDDFCESYDYDDSKGSGFDNLVMCHGRFFQREHENESWFSNRVRRARHRHLFGELYPSAKRKYNEAWLSYVTEVRKKQKAFFEAEYKRLMEEMDSQMQARLAPEVPPHLLER